MLPNKLTRPFKDDLFTIIYQNQIKSFIEDKLKAIGCDFIGFGEHSQFGKMFASSDPRIANLLYESSWYADDPAINRPKKHEPLSPIYISKGINKLHTSIIEHKRNTCEQAGNFTVPIKIGDTEIFFSIACKTTSRLRSLRHEKFDDLCKLCLQFRLFMNKITNQRSFSMPIKARELQSYYIHREVACTNIDTIKKLSVPGIIEYTRLSPNTESIFKVYYNKQKCFFTNSYEEGVYHQRNHAKVKRIFVINESKTPKFIHINNDFIRNDSFLLEDSIFNTKISKKISN